MSTTHLVPIHRAKVGDVFLSKRGARYEIACIDDMGDHYLLGTYPGVTTGWHCAKGSYLRVVKEKSPS